VVKKVAPPLQSFSVYLSCIVDLKREVRVHSVLTIIATDVKA